MRGLFLLFACATATTRLPHDPCKCNDYVKFDNGSVWDRASCCVGWVRRAAVDELLKVDGIVYQRINGTELYKQYSEFDMRQVEFPGEFSVLYDADNQYTNFTCKSWSCRMAVVWRNRSENASCAAEAYLNGDCVDYDAPRDEHAPLCHNSTAAKCVIWVPIESGGVWLVALIVVLSVLGLAVLFVAVYMAGAAQWREGMSDGSDTSNATVDCCMVLSWWVFVFTLSEISLVVLCRLDEWMSRTGVDLGYITYQTCIRKCSLLADKNVDIAAVNQCYDRGVQCGGAMSEGSAVSCQSCQSHRDDWMMLQMFVVFLKGVILFHWVMIAAYANGMRASVTGHRGVVCAIMLPVLGIFNACAALTSMVGLCGVRGLSVYSSPFGRASVYDLGLAWTICSGVWWFIFTIAKAVSADNRRCARTPLTARYQPRVLSEMVFGKN